MLNPPQSQRRPLRVAFLTPDLGLGGAERWILSLASNFVAARPVGLCIARGNWIDPQMMSEAKRIMPVHRNEYRFPVGSDKFDKRAWIEGLGVALRKTMLEADVVLSWGMDLEGIIENMSRPLVDVMHCAADLGESFRELAARSCSQAHYVAAVTEAALTCVPEDKRHGVAIIHNGADPNRVAPRFGREKTRQRLGLDKSRRLALFIGRMDPSIKRPQKLIEALRILPDHWRALFVGADLGGGDKVRAEAERYAQGRAMFMPATTHVGDLLAAADVLCVPSRSEAHCLVVNEAWLAGTPVVTCDYAAMKEFDRLHGSLCWLVPVQCDGHQLSAAITEADESGRDGDRVAHARRIAWEHYTSPAMAARWEAHLIENVLPDWYRHALYGGKSGKGIAESG